MLGILNDFFLLSFAFESLIVLMQLSFSSITKYKALFSKQKKVTSVDRILTARQSKNQSIVMIEMKGNSEAHSVVETCTLSTET